MECETSKQPAVITQQTEKEQCVHTLHTEQTENSKGVHTTNGNKARGCILYQTRVLCHIPNANEGRLFEMSAPFFVGI